MNRIARWFTVVAFAAMLLPSNVLAQVPVRPFHDGGVWSMSFIKIKTGYELKYMNYVATDWKTEQEALKKAGLILDYTVIATESHSTSDFDLILATEYKDLATMEANQEKEEEVANKALDTNDQKTLAGYQERASWREILGNRLGREIILSPKK